MREIQKMIGDFIEDRPIMQENNRIPGRIIQLLLNEVNEFVEVAGTDKQNEELADIVFFVCSIANIYGIDLEKEVREKTAVNHMRYPAVEFQEGDYYEVYSRLKEEGRKVKEEFYSTES